MYHNYVADTYIKLSSSSVSRVIDMRNPRSLPVAYANIFRGAGNVHLGCGIARV